MDIYRNRNERECGKHSDIQHTKDSKDQRGPFFKGGYILYYTIYISLSLYTHTRINASLFLLPLSLFILNPIIHNMGASSMVSQVIGTWKNSSKKKRRSARAAFSLGIQVHSMVVQYKSRYLWNR